MYYFDSFELALVRLGALIRTSLGRRVCLAFVMNECFCGPLALAPSFIQTLFNFQFLFILIRFVLCKLKNEIVFFGALQLVPLSRAHCSVFDEGAFSWVFDQ